MMEQIINSITSESLTFGYEERLYVYRESSRPLSRRLFDESPVRIPLCVQYRLDAGR